MKKFPIYRIIKNTYYEKCEVKSEYYTVEYQKPFLFFLETMGDIKRNCHGVGR